MDVGPAGSVGCVVHGFQVVSEPDPRKIGKEGLAHRLGWKCTLRKVRSGSETRFQVRPGFDSYLSLSLSPQLTN